jgi:hypothetical protein
MDDFGAQEGAAHPTWEDFGSEGVDLYPRGMPKMILSACDNSI